MLHDVAGNIRASGAGRKMFLDIPFYRTGVYTNNGDRYRRENVDDFFSLPSSQLSTRCHNTGLTRDDQF
jgi:hypothetical protein